MELKQLYSRRDRRSRNYAIPIIYEWEDIISEVMNTEKYMEINYGKQIRKNKKLQKFCIFGK